MPSIFTRIVNGEIPCYKLAEDDKHLCFLDISPLEEGHALVIPKKEIDYIFDLPEEDYIALFRFAKKAAHAIEQVIDCKRIGIAVVGLEVPHAHIHLVPLHSEDIISFSQKRKEISPDQMQQIAAKINAAFEAASL